MTKTHDAMISALKKINVTRVPAKPIPRTRTHILSLDALFRGGLPKERMVEIFGPENSGKSTIGTILIPRQYVAQGKYVCILDAEKSFDLDYAEKFGFEANAVDDQGRPYVDILRTQTAEQWLEALRTILSSDLYDLVVIDSLAKFAPRVEAESTMDKGTMGVFPRLMARFWRVLGAVDYKATLLVLNQERLDIGEANIYTGAPRTSPGGKSTRHESAVKIQMMSPMDIRDGDTIQGIVLRMKVVKSKLFTPNTKHVHQLRIAIQGNIHEVDHSYELYEAAKHLGLLTDKDGKPYEKNIAYFEGEKLANGEKQILEFLDEPSELKDRLEVKVMEATLYGPNATRTEHSQSPSDAEQTDDRWDSGIDDTVEPDPSWDAESSGRGWVGTHS